MIQNEIDEISEAFSDAWKEYFGQLMYYIPFDISTTESHTIYKESKKKGYDELGKKSFYGTFKQDNLEEKGELAGKVEYEVAEITFVTKELYDQGITRIDSRALIEITHRDGITKRYNIIANFGKVQLGDNKVFYKLKVTDRDNE